MKILVIDVGGSNVKFRATDQDEPRKFPSGDKLTPQQMVTKIREQTADWDYEAISLGLPAPFGKNGLRSEPDNLGDGWVGFDFAKALGKPTKVINDAAMQALGAYEGGRMLFLGLGTGLGSTLIISRIILPLELGRLLYADATIVDYLGKEGLEKHGKERWLRAIHEVVPILREACVADHVVLGGGEVEQVEELPEGTKRGGNSDAFEGGFRLWETEVVHTDHAPAPEVWRVVV